MRLKPLGIVYTCNDWAQTPTPLVMADRVRVFVAARDEDGKSFVRAVDLDLDDPTKVIGGIDKVLGRGKPGCFDQDGAMPSYAKFEALHTVRLWYSGWTQCVTTPYHNATGIAVSKNGGRSFEREHDGPAFDRTENEPYLRVTPCLFDGRIWYVSGTGWLEKDGKYEPTYRIKEFDSGKEAFPDHPKLACHSRPWVFRQGGYLRMIYSWRGAFDYRDGKNAYELRAAYSVNDGKNWHDDYSEFTLPRTPGFDDTMQAYGATFDVKGKTYMVYNGSGFGKHGFALAVMED